MNALILLKHLQRLPYPFIQSRQISAMLDMSPDLTSKHLSTLQAQGFLENVKGGKWVLKNNAYEPMQIAEFLVSPYESYISLHSALFFHGIIDQIPSRIYSVTVDRSKVVTTTLGTYSFHHCHPDFFIGFDYIKPYLKIAKPEKALVDYFYFSPSKLREFSRLVEIELPKKFSFKKAFEYLEKIPSLRTKGLVRNKLLSLKNRHQS